MDQPIIGAQIRTTKGKGAARKLRRNNQVPAIFYGPHTEPKMLAVDYPELKRVLTKSASEIMVLNLNVQTDQGIENHKVMLKELIVDPVKDTYLHADFCEISMDKEITVDIPIRLTGIPEGVSMGGTLQHGRREMTISCLPDRLIDSVEVDISELMIGDVLHVKDIPLPEGVASVDDGHLTVAAIAAPSIKAAGQGADDETAGTAEE